MHIEGLHIENFLTIGEAKLSLTDKGLVLVQGDNRDNSSANSNGAGKSSVADAIKWVFYGSTARGESGDKVVNRFAGKNCRVVATVRDGAEVYEIARHRKHKEGKNSLTLRMTAPSDADLTKGTDKLTQIEVNRILGCSEEVFDAAVYAGQERMPDLPAMTDKPLKLLIEEAAGITILERAYELARGQATTAERALALATTRLDSLKTRIDGEHALIEDLGARRETWETDRTGRVQAEAQTARDLADQARAMDAEIAGLDEAGVRAGLDECTAALAAVKDEHRHKAELEDALGDVQRKLAVATSTANRLAREAQTQKATLDDIGGRVGVACGECGKHYEEADLAGAKKLATDKLRQIVTTAKDARVEVENLTRDAGERENALKAFVAGMTDISATSALQGRLSGELRGIEAKKGERARIADRARQHAQNVAKMKAETNPFDKMIEEKKAAVLVLTGDVGAAEADVTKAREEFELAQAAVKVFGPAGVRAEILDTVTPFLNARTAHYLGHLSDGNISATWSTLSTTAKGELREKFCIEVSDATGAENFGGLSGGEKRKVRLACCLALQDLVASRATKPINLWIGDEIDTALDVAGLERLMSILEEKARERGTVLVISHVDLKDWIRQIVTVTKQGGMSTIEGVLTHV